MIRVVAFEPEHLAALKVQSAQAELAVLGEAERWMTGRARKVAGPCFTAFVGEHIVFCGGAIVTHPELATIWAAFADDAGPAMLAIERRTRRWLATLPHRRIDTMVRVAHSKGNRFVHRLGFRAEASLADYFADGSAALIYRLEGRQ